MAADVNLNRSDLGTSLYEALEVSPRASQDVILAAYRALARTYHPDRNSEPAAGERMQQLNAAYAVLSDPRQRAAYDVNCLRSQRAQRFAATPLGAKRAAPPGSSRNTRVVVAERQSSGPVTPTGTRFGGMSIAIATMLILLCGLALAIWMMLALDADSPIRDAKPAMITNLRFVIVPR